MKRMLLTILLGLVVAGCGGTGPKPGEEAPEAPLVSRVDLCVPYNVAVEVEAGRALVRFKADCTVLTSGYNIYVSREPLVTAYPGTVLPAEVTPWNQPVFPGDTNPEDGVEVYEAEGLSDGVPYYVHVRTVFADRSLSAPSEELLIVPGPRGVMDLAVRYKGEQDGFSFARDGYVRADNVDNDLYYYALDGKDYLGSPNQLGFLRRTRFRLLPFRGEYGEVTAEMAKLSSLPGEDRVAVKAGDWVQVMTEDKTFALLRVDGAAGEGSGRRLKIWYAYSPAVGAPVF